MIKKIQHKLHGKIRIIGGKWKGQKLNVIDSYELRPTTNRIRETLFNWLIPVIQGSKCLDCFSGSGALSIEALSRNASFVTLIELKHPIIIQLMANLSKLKAENTQVIYGNTLKYLAQPSTTNYDIIFIDPPFGKGLLQQTAFLLEKNSWFKKHCWIYIETEKAANLDILPHNWYLYRKKITAQVKYCLYIRNQ